jgi:molecular chaperone GrpE
MTDKRESTRPEEPEPEQQAAEGEPTAAERDAEQAEASSESVQPEQDSGGSSELQAEVDKLREALLRTRADMDNMQKRAERDMERARRYQHEALMRDLLPVIDGLEQGLDNAGEDDASREGLELTHRLLLKTLQDHGLEVLDPVGERFDPQWHEAMSMQPSEDADPDTVVMVLQKGYRLDDRLLRAARVIVATEPGD